MTDTGTGGTDGSGAPPAASELSSALADVLTLLRSVAAGDLSKRLTPRYSEEHPVGALAMGVNAMADALAQARATTESHQRELRDRIAIIESQQIAIRELSTPVIEVWDGVLCLPVVGVLDSVRASEMTSALLGAVVAKKALFVVVDITGIQVMDTRATDHFIRMARSVRLLGSRCVLSGVNPSIALTIVRMGVELHDLKSHRNMRDALRFCTRAVARVRSSTLVAGDRAATLSQSSRRSEG